MPLYDFECGNNKCEKNDKILQYIVPLAVFDKPIKCPSCGKPLMKMLSAPYFKVN